MHQTKKPTIEELCTASDETLLVHEGIIFPRVLLPFFLPYFCTVNYETNLQTWHGLKCECSIYFANEYQKQTYVSAHTNI